MFKLNYFSLKEDFEELKNSALKRDKALAGGKVLVKGANRSEERREGKSVSAV